jgi:3-oxoacyl-[acyl-carrier protein] reductase
MSRTVLVTGATGVLGRAVVRRLQTGGNSVVAVSRSQSKANELQSAGVPAVVIPDRPSLEALDTAVRAASTLAADTPSGRLDSVVFCGGATCSKLLLRSPDSVYEEMMEANFYGPMRITRSVLKLTDLAKRPGGAFVGLSSVVAADGNAGQSAYGASKAAMEGFFKSLSREYGPRNVRFVIVSPGLIESEMAAAVSAEGQDALVRRTALNRLGKPDDVASAVTVALDCEYMTGCVIRVDGGM